MSFKSASSALGATFAILALAPVAAAADMKADGTFDGSVVQQVAHPLDRPDHLVVAEMFRGTARSPGTPWDGAEVLLSETIVIDQGNGPQQGTSSFVNDRGSFTDEYHGTVKTVIVDGQPRTTASGVWTMVAGTGFYAGGSGHGTYFVGFTSKTTFSGEFKGVLSVPKKEAAR